MVIAKKKRNRNSIDSKQSMSSNIDHSIEQRQILHVGSQGKKVESLQSFLSKEGLYKHNIDGIYGPLTEAAVKEFQRKHILVVNGVVGFRTEDLINKLQPIA